jgi:16S rRNA (guanine1516-N2)-methyltransferase
MTYTLIYRHNRLALDVPALGKPFYIEFDKRRYQGKNSDLKNELLAKAIGIKKNMLPEVCDLTAGFGQDAFLLYSLGCEVSLVERSPVIAALLKDGLARAGCEIELYIGEASEYLHHLRQIKKFPEVIYFDPIFPQTSKTALSQKHARILRAVAGDDRDAIDVFEAALETAKHRIVVKRPLHAKNISDKHIPHIVYKGKIIRFDVYLKF